MSPSLLRRLAVRLLGESGGWLRCPDHGYQRDPLLHGYSSGYPGTYRRCQSPGCDFRVMTVG